MGKRNELEKWTQRWVNKLTYMRYEIEWDIGKKRLSKFRIRCYVRCIPLKGVHNGWPEAVYETGESLVRLLYDYSKSAGYIVAETSINDFIQEAKEWRLFE